MHTPTTAARQSKLAAIFETIEAAQQVLGEAKKGHHVGKDGKEHHSSGKKKNKQFANNTTFRSAPSDALLHTDGNKQGIRAKLPKEAFVRAATKEELKKDPRKKWYPVSYQRGWASAAGSLRQAYARGGDIKKEVVAKVKKTHFLGAEGKPISAGTIDPTGALKGARGECKIKRVPHGDGTRRKVELRPSHPAHQHVQKLRAAGEHDRAREVVNRFAKMCKDHGAGGPPEHKQDFAPSNSKHQTLHAKGWAPSHGPGVSHDELTQRAAKIKGQVRGMMRQSKASSEFLTR